MAGEKMAMAFEMAAAAWQNNGDGAWRRSGAATLRWRRGAAASSSAAYRHRAMATTPWQKLQQRRRVAINRNMMKRSVKINGENGGGSINNGEPWRGEMPAGGVAKMICESVSGWRKRRSNQRK